MLSNAIGWIQSRLPLGRKKNRKKAAVNERFSSSMKSNAPQHSGGAPRAVAPTSPDKNAAQPEPAGNEKHPPVGVAVSTGQQQGDVRTLDQNSQVSKR